MKFAAGRVSKGPGLLIGETGVGIGFSSGMIAPVLGERRVLHASKLRWLRALGWMVALVLIIGLAFGPSLEAMQRLAGKDPALKFAARIAACLIVLAVYS